MRFEELLKAQKYMNSGKKTTSINTSHEVERNLQEWNFTTNRRKDTDIDSANREPLDKAQTDGLKTTRKKSSCS